MHAVYVCDFAIMPRGDIVCTQAFGFFQKRSEFNFAVAKHVGVGGSACFVFGKEVRKHTIHIFLGEIDGVIRNIEYGANTAHVGEIVFGGATPVFVRFVPILHKKPHDVIALLF